MGVVRARRAAALFAALLVVTGYSSPSAAAVGPPAIDDASLPLPAAPAPPGPTEQSAPCRSGDGRTEAMGRVQMAAADRDALWQLTRGSGQVVAVVDTGVSRHRLLPHLVPGGDYVSTGDGTQDCDGHGTIVAGIIGGAPSGPAAAGDGFSGIAPDAEILSIRQSSNVFRRAGESSGPGVGDVETLAQAVRTAADAGATVINVSSVACAPAAEPIDDRALGAAIAYAVDVKNVVIVAAAGNVGAQGRCRGQNPLSGPVRRGSPDWDGVDVVVSPSWYDDYVLTVGSVDAEGRPSTFSLAGPWVDVAAPGEAVVSLDPDGEGLITISPESADDQPISGTSYAAPIVSAIAALIRSRSPRLTARQVMQRIEDTAIRPTAGWDPQVGHGVVDAVAAVSGHGANSAPAPPPNAPAVSPSPLAAHDPRPRSVAFIGAAVCIALAAAALLATGSRRRGEAVAND